MESAAYRYLDLSACSIRSSQDKAQAAWPCNFTTSVMVCYLLSVDLTSYHPLSQAARGHMERRPSILSQGTNDESFREDSRWRHYCVGRRLLVFGVFMLGRALLRYATRTCRYRFRARKNIRNWSPGPVSLCLRTISGGYPKPMVQCNTIQCSTMPRAVEKVHVAF